MMTSTKKALTENQKQVVNKVFIPVVLKDTIRLEAKRDGVHFVRIKNSRSGKSK